MTQSNSNVVTASKPACDAKEHRRYRNSTKHRNASQKRPTQRTGRFILLTQGGEGAQPLTNPSLRRVMGKIVGAKNSSKTQKTSKRRIIW